MFKALVDLFRVKPVDESLLAKKVDSMPQPERAAPAPSPQAEQIAKAVANKVTAPKKTQPKKPAVKKTRTAKKQ